MTKEEIDIIINKGYSREHLHDYRDIIYKLTGENIKLQGCSGCLARSLYNKIIRILKEKNYV